MHTHTDLGGKKNSYFLTCPKISSTHTFIWNFSHAMKKILGHDICIQAKRTEMVGFVFFLRQHLYGKKYNSDCVLFHFLTPKD